MQHEIALLRTDIRKEMADMRAEMRGERITFIMWLAGMLVAQAAATAALVKLL